MGIVYVFLFVLLEVFVVIICYFSVVMVGLIWFKWKDIFFCCNVYGKVVLLWVI